jgi:myo-inositol-1(or 4)-monophosphatase
MRPETAAAIEAVRQALAMSSAGPAIVTIAHKGGRDVVTSVDRSVEVLVRESIREELDQPVVGEELGGHPSSDGSPYWLVDPICGTRNFASGIPLHCVNLALVERGAVQVAVVGDSSTREVLFAERGEGTWRLRGESPVSRLSVSSDSRTLVVEDGRARLARREQCAQFMAAVVRADRWDFRSFGSTVTLPYVASGRVSAYVVFYVPALHAAAGSLLVSEAGGVVTDIDGQRWTLDSDSLLAAASEHLHADLATLARRTVIA